MTDNKDFCKICQCDCPQPNSHARWSQWNPCHERWEFYATAPSAPDQEETQKTLKRIEEIEKRLDILFDIKDDTK